MKYIMLLLVIFFATITNANATNIEEIKTSDGLTAWLVEEHSLPILSFKIIFKNAGSAYDPKNKLGLAQLAVKLLDEGAGDYDGISYKKRLEELAIKLSFSLDKDNLYVNVTTLRKHYKQAIKFLMLALEQPHLNKDDIERTKKQIKTSIENSEENPEHLANLAWNQIAFKNHPYKNPVKGIKKTIDSITRDDIKSYIENNFRKENIIISIVGDINKLETMSVINSSFNTLPKKHTPSKIVKDVYDLPLGAYNFLEKPNPQSIMVFATKGVKYKDKDFYPAYILNHILGGGGFESRLMNIIREQKGLAYKIYSYLSIPQHTALIKGSLGTKNESLKEVIYLLKDIFADLNENGVSASELESAKQYLIGSYPLRLDTNSKLADGLAFIQLEGLGIDFIDRRNQLVKDVTIEQINHAARKLLNPDDLIISIVGGKN